MQSPSEPYQRFPQWHQNAAVTKWAATPAGQLHLHENLLKDTGDAHMDHPLYQAYVHARINNGHVGDWAGWQQKYEAELHESHTKLQNAATNFPNDKQKEVFHQTFPALSETELMKAAWKFRKSAGALAGEFPPLPTGRHVLGIHNGFDFGSLKLDHLPILHTSYHKAFEVVDCNKQFAGRHFKIVGSGVGAWFEALFLLSGGANVELFQKYDARQSARRGPFGGVYPMFFTNAKHWPALLAFAQLQTNGHHEFLPDWFLQHLQKSRTATDAGEWSYVERYIANLIDYHYGAQSPWPHHRRLTLKETPVQPDNTCDNDRMLQICCEHVDCPVIVADGGDFGSFSASLSDTGRSRVLQIAWSFTYQYENPVTDYQEHLLSLLSIPPETRLAASNNKLHPTEPAYQTLLAYLKSLNGRKLDFAIGRQSKWTHAEWLKLLQDYSPLANMTVHQVNESMEQALHCAYESMLMRRLYTFPAFSPQVRVLYDYEMATREQVCDDEWIEKAVRTYEPRTATRPPIYFLGRASGWGAQTTFQLEGAYELSQSLLDVRPYTFFRQKPLETRRVYAAQKYEEELYCHGPARRLIQKWHDSKSTSLKATLDSLAQIGQKRHGLLTVHLNNLHHRHDQIFYEYQWNGWTFAEEKSLAEIAAWTKLHPIDDTTKKLLDELMSSIEREHEGTPLHKRLDPGAFRRVLEEALKIEATMMH